MFSRASVISNSIAKSVRTGRKCCELPMRDKLEVTDGILGRASVNPVFGGVLKLDQSWVGYLDYR